MNFRETVQSDLDFMADNSVSRGIQKHCPEQIDYCYTLEHEGNVLGVGGLRFINLTTMWCWLDMTHLASEYIIVCYRVIKEWMDIFVKEHSIKRLQCYIEKDFEEAIRMVQHLGFKYESTMPNFVGNCPAYLYVKFYGVSDGIENK